MEPYLELLSKMNQFMKCIFYRSGIKIKYILVYKFFFLAIPVSISAMAPSPVTLHAVPKLS
ncbi:hypothetical protein UT300001_08260 [Clostridium sp. CTA-1]